MSVTYPATQVANQNAKTAAVGSATSGTAAGTENASALSPDFETFLRMLTTQMQNQDPLNPIDSADYAVQLATFSGVEQQMKTNQLIEGLSSQFGAMGMAQLAGWVGMEARTTQPVWFGGSPVTLQITPDTGSDRAVMVVKDSTGTEVSRQDVTATTGEIEWAGTRDDGTPLPSGQYSFVLESYRGATPSATTAVPAYGRITEARAGETGAVLVLEGGAEVPSAEISALRAPG